MTRKHPITWGLFMLVATYGVAGFTETIDTSTKPLGRIKPGTILAKPAPNGWSHLILFARPRLGAGDVEAAPASASRFVSMFSTAMVARVSKQNGLFRLDDVAVGHAMNIDGKQVIVTPATATALGGKLGLFGGRVLTAAEEALDEVQQVARYSTMMLFDAKALVHYDGKHRPMTVRHVIWVSKQTGKLGAAVWLLSHRANNAFALAEKDFVVLPPQLVEDRVLHVDKTQFTLGVPGKEAFALEKLPRGARYAFTDDLKKSASLHRFTSEQVQQLAVSFAQAVAKGPIVVAQRDE